MATPHNSSYKILFPQSGEVASLATFSDFMETPGEACNGRKFVCWPTEATRAIVLDDEAPPWDCRRCWKAVFVDSMDITSRRSVPLYALVALIPDLITSIHHHTLREEVFLQNTKRGY